MKQLKTVDQLVSWRLCLGCGACLHACEDKNIKLIDIPDEGLRPTVNTASCKRCGKCMEVCPGAKVTHQKFNDKSMPQLRRSWGPVLEVWEGYASDPEIRFRGSSGGLVTALALFCQKEKQMAGVLHIGADPQKAWRNVPVISRNRSELLANSGSRYSPAAPCEMIASVEKADSPCVFVGKPCDVEALYKLQQVKPKLKDKVGLSISIFCAGTPSTNGNKAMLEVMGVKPSEVVEIRYRGCGWPGMTTVKHRDNGQLYQLTYEQSWGQILSNYVPLRCRLCPDGTGEFADISCGDPWYRDIEPDEPGQSLILVRTERGRRLLRDAIDAGYIKLVKAEHEIVALSQKSLLNKRRNLWGRLFAMHLMRVPTPHFVGFSLFAGWWKLSVSQQIRSVFGTFYRIVSRKLNRPSDNCSTGV
ncbi:MAG: Coenzyme F420 hydrogenase/dehydrogenase, beta subunit C-terminal domain [Sedimentisphaerales bacterium]|nr:Coenzyme F420 hydrogenase/dehydrogenase, beta subunit C-terminal domain [Sedimentisphaerales bacterium]